MKKRILSIIIAAVMCLTLSIPSVFADETGLDTSVYGVEVIDYSAISAMVTH